MNIDKLIKDSLNNRTSSLDISNEKFEEMLDYIEDRADKASQHSLHGTISKFKELISRISVKQWATASLILLFIIVLPLISKDGLNTSEDKMQSDTSSRTNTESNKYEEFPTTDSKNDNNLGNRSSDDHIVTNGQKNIIITLTPRLNIDDSHSYLTDKDLSYIVNFLYSQGSKKIYINDIAVSEKSIIGSSDDGNSLIIDNSSISVRETIVIRTISKAKDLSENLKLDSLENYSIDIQIGN